MATKWKNTTNKVIRQIKEHKVVCFGILALIPPVVILRYMSYRAIYLNTSEAWFLGIIGNILLAFSIWAILTDVFKARYKNWIPNGEEYYSQWKAKCKQQQKIILAIGLIGTVMSYLYFRLQFQWFYGNYATGYVLFATVFFQLSIVELCTIRWMHKQLDAMMECVRKINKKSLEEAIKIERDSIEKAAKSERMKVDLISNVSHDLKTPLTSMVGYIELMKKEELTDTVADYVSVISDKAEKLKEMIESLFSISKASSGNVELHLETLELNMVIKQILADMSDRIKESGLQFVPILTVENTKLVTDNIHIYRICQNLIENALKYSANGTRVFIKTTIREIEFERNICLEITNTAGYFMKFDKEGVLERFARGDEARSTDGNGLGLAIVSTYTSALGGSFDIAIDCDQFKATLAFKSDLQ